ncbi:MAG: DUF58 domain-containing protein [Planctomycetaceae bacterium]|nr:DUF58 domain-containing protein [Planctomycetaceae bacterium]
MTQDSKRFLPPEVVQRISRLELQARNVVEGFLSGLHRSPYFGQSIEFAQHRQYTPGDDVRRIDWKVFSKTDKVYIKQYEEETNLRTSLLLDVSESMSFQSGDKSKLEYATQLTAAMAYLLLRQQDSVGLTTFDDQVQNTLPFRSKHTHLHAILEILAKSEAGKSKTSIFNILKRTAEQRVRRGLIVLVSDLFTDREELFKGLQLLRLRGHDVMLFHVLDQQEVNFDYSGTTKFEGMEETGELVCDPRGLRDDYLSAMDQYLTEVRRFCAGHVIDYKIILTNENLDAALSHYLKHRIGMRRG